MLRGHRLARSRLSTLLHSTSYLFEKGGVQRGSQSLPSVKASDALTSAPSAERILADHAAAQPKSGDADVYTDVDIPRSESVRAWSSALSKRRSALEIADEDLEAMMSLRDAEPSARTKAATDDPLNFLDKSLDVDSSKAPKRLDAAAAQKAAAEQADALRLLGHTEDTIAQLVAQSTEAATARDGSTTRRMRYPADIISRPGAAAAASAERPADALAAAAAAPREPDAASTSNYAALSRVPVEFQSPFASGGVTRREEDRVWEQGLFGRLVRGANSEILARRPGASDRAKVQERKSALLRAKLAQNNLNVHVQASRLMMEEMYGDEGLAAEESPIGQQTPIYLFDYDREKRKQLEVFMHSIRSGVVFKKVNKKYRAAFLEGVNPAAVQAAFRAEREALTPEAGVVGRDDYYGMLDTYFYEFYSLRVKDLTPDVVQAVREKMRPVALRNAREDAWQRAISGHKNWLRRVLHEPAMPTFNESWRVNWLKETDGDESAKLYKEHRKRVVDDDIVERLKDAEVAAWKEKGPALPTAMDRLHLRERAAVAKMLAGDSVGKYLRETHLKGGSSGGAEKAEGGDRDVDGTVLTHALPRYNELLGGSQRASAAMGEASGAGGGASGAAQADPLRDERVVRMSAAAPTFDRDGSRVTTTSSAASRPIKLGSTGARADASAPSTSPSSTPSSPTLRSSSMASDIGGIAPNARGVPRRRRAAVAALGGGAEADARAESMLRHSTSVTASSRVSNTARWAAIQGQIDSRRETVVGGLASARAAAAADGIGGARAGSKSGPLVGSAKAKVIDLPPEAAPARTRSFRGKVRPNGTPYSRLQIAYITAAHTEAEAQTRTKAVDEKGDAAIPAELKPEFISALRHKASVSSRRVMAHEPRPSLKSVSAATAPRQQGAPEKRFGREAVRVADAEKAALTDSQRAFESNIVDAFDAGEGEGEGGGDAAGEGGVGEWTVSEIDDPHHATRAAAAASAWMTSPTRSAGRSSALQQPHNDEGLVKLQRLQAARALGQQREGMNVDIAMAELQALLPADDWDPAQAKAALLRSNMQVDVAFRAIAMGGSLPSAARM